MNDFHAELLSQDRIKTFYQEVNNHRQFKHAFPTKTSWRLKVLVLWQHVRQRLKGTRYKPPESRA